MTERLSLKSVKEEQIAGADGGLREERRALNELQEQRASVEVEIAQKSMALQNLRDRIREKYQVDLDTVRSECITITFADDFKACPMTWAQCRSLLSIMPRNRRQTYDARKLLNLVVDRGSFFEIAPLYGRARVTGLARLDGYPVGIMINNPRHGGGSTDVAAGSKAMRLMQLCDTFHLPLISLADEPGFMVGPESERSGIERAGARMVAMVCNSRMPWATVVIGRLYGVAGQCHHRPTGMFRRFAWPSANWGSMHIAGGVSAAYRRDIASAPDPDAKRREIEARLQAIASPFRTAEATGQDIIDPRETRGRLVEFVHDAQRLLSRQLGPPPMPYLP